MPRVQLIRGLARTIEKADLSADDKAKWDSVFKQVRQRLTQGTFDPGLIAKLEQLAR